MKQPIKATAVGAVTGVGIAAIMIPRPARSVFARPGVGLCKQLYPELGICALLALHTWLFE